MKDGIDINATPSFRFLALTSRLGVDVSGYQIGNVYFGAKIEGDFYAGLSSVDAEKYPGVKTFFPNNTKIMGTAMARLRQAYATITWKDLPLSKEEKASVGLKIGQAWHPMGADMPHLFSLSKRKSRPVSEVRKVPWDWLLKVVCKPLMLMPVFNV